MAPQRRSRSSLPWPALLQVGLSTMLVVLFAVVIGHSRQQQQELNALQQRVQTLERASSLDQAASEGGQVRAFAQRLQDLEAREAEQRERSEAERIRLQRLITELGSRTYSGGGQAAGSPAQGGQPEESLQESKPSP